MRIEVVSGNLRAASVTKRFLWLSRVITYWGTAAVNQNMRQAMNDYSMPYKLITM